MRTNIVINDELMSQAMKLSGLKTKREVVEEGLKRLIYLERKKKLLKLSAKVEFWPDYNYRALREGK